MNHKKVNLTFLISIILYISLLIIGSLFANQLLEDLVLSNFLVESILVLPAIIMVLFSEEKPVAFLHFRKMKLGTGLAIIPFTLFSMPVITVMNLLSQFVTTNEAAAAMEEAGIGNMNYFLILGSVGLFAPFCEEVLCRGVYYRGYERTGGKLKALLLASFLFAIVHMNLNQAAYAMVMGIMAVLLVEATGSLWSSIIYHALINSSQVTLMYLMLHVDSSAFSSAQNQMTGDMMVYALGAYLIIAAVCLPLAWAILIWMSAHEGNHGALLAVWKSQKKDKLVSFSLILALILCVLMMCGFASVILQMIIK